MIRLRTSVLGLLFVACDRSPSRIAGDAGPAPDATPRAVALDASTRDAAPPTPAPSGAPPGATWVLAEGVDGGRLPSGGPWERCADGFRAETSARRDLLRLTTLCGPANGQKRVASADGVAGPAPVRAPFEARPGQCVRVFAAADAGVTSVGLEVVAPDGAAVGAQSVAGRWAMLRDDRPLCLAAGGAFTAQARGTGRGAVALEVWLLP